MSCASLDTALAAVQQQMLLVLLLLLQVLPLNAAEQEVKFLWHLYELLKILRATANSRYLRACSFYVNALKE